MITTRADFSLDEEVEAENQKPVDKLLRDVGVNSQQGRTFVML